MNCFQVCKKLFGYFCILVFLFCWCEVISVRSGYPHFLWVVTRDHSPDTAHVYLPTSSPLSFTTKDVLITFL